MKACNRLARAAFGLDSARRLTVTPKTSQRWRRLAEAGPGPVGTYLSLGRKAVFSPRTCPYPGRTGRHWSSANRRAGPARRLSAPQYELERRARSKRPPPPSIPRMRHVDAPVRIRRMFKEIGIWA